MDEFTEGLKKLFGNANIMGNFDKNLQQIRNMLETGAKDISTKTIETKSGSSSKNTYKTDITATGDIKNSVPTEPPQTDDVYWNRHNELVDKVLQNRVEIILKAIEVSGTTVKGIINPISVSNIDVAKIIQSLKNQ